MSPDPFIGRWSRLKRAEAEAAARDRAAAEPEATPPSAPGGAETRDDGIPGGAEMTAAEIEALPRIEDLAPGDDIRAFLRRGVPKALRQAALRKAWRLNPAIRDYVDAAREYALDYNAPGGMPGWGDVSPQEVAALLGGLFGSQERSSRGPEAPTPESGTAPEILAAKTPAPPQAPAPRTLAGADEPAGGGAPADPPASAGTSAAPPRRARHGGATPV